jgi:hypothetical protein
MGVPVSGSVTVCECASYLVRVPVSGCVSVCVGVIVSQRCVCEIM